MKKVFYNRQAALAYAAKWAFSRNPKYYDFSNIGGDCTNFISQCIFEGINVMNYTPNTGWYYINSYNRAPAWTSAEFLGKFLISNNGAGPMGSIVARNEIEVGDIIQLSFANNLFTHSLFVVSTYPEITIATHTNDAYNRPISSYTYENIRYIHIVGGQKY
ncbi:MAG TPA: amidase domain-containing protein [Clostridia bacterium]